MEFIKKLMNDALEELVDEDFKKFNWQLWNGVVTDMGPIPRAKLQKADRSDVVDHMVEKYSDEAGNVAVKALRNINQNHLAKTLESKLQEARPSEWEETRNAPMSVEEPPIQSDWKRPFSITPSSQQFMNRLLTEKRNDIYIPKNKSQRRRLALLINNIQFNNTQLNRPGAEKDEANMEWLLKALGYRVQIYRNLSGRQIATAVRNFAALPDHNDSDSTFVVLMSHGDKIHNKDAILGVNYHQHNPNDYFFVADIFTHLNSVNCPALIDKPKVILIHACRGGNLGGVEIQSDAIVHIEKDFVSFKSCLPDIVAYRNIFEGSYFFCYILEVFCKWAHIDDIMELFRRVTSCMATDPRFKQSERKLMPCIDRTSLPKKFYLFPGL